MSEQPPPYSATEQKYPPQPNPQMYPAQNQGMCMVSLIVVLCIRFVYY